MRWTFLALVLLSTVACSVGGPQSRAASFSSTDVAVTTRGVSAPATLVVPDRDGPVPLVVMAHGHGGSRQEGGGYEQMAEAFATLGIASIRIDFPGCGDSDEPFTENNLSNMMKDMQAARDFAVATGRIDTERVGLLGYSMGGRVVSLLSAEDRSYRTMALWTPAVSPGAEREWSSLGGPDTYAALRAKAHATGIATYTTRWGSELSLGPRWFTDLENSEPLVAVSRFEGPLLVLYGDRDDVVVPDVSESAIRAAASSSRVVRHIVEDADHGLGFYDNRAPIAAEVVETTAEFFAAQL